MVYVRTTILMDTVKYTTTMYNGMTAQEAYETEKINIVMIYK